MFKNLLVVVATAGLALAPVAVHANTRASSAAVSMAAMPQAGGTGSWSWQDRSRRGGWWQGQSLQGSTFSRAWLFGLFGAAAVAIIALIESKGGVVIDDPVSPGT